MEIKTKSCCRDPTNPRPKDVLVWRKSFPHRTRGNSHLEWYIPTSTSQTVRMNLHVLWFHLETPRGDLTNDLKMHRRDAIKGGGAPRWGELKCPPPDPASLRSLRRGTRWATSDVCLFTTFYQRFITYINYIYILLHISYNYQHPGCAWLYYAKP